MNERKLQVRIVVPELQILILRVTGRVVQLVCYIVPNITIFQKSQNDLNYHIAKNHSSPKPDVTFKCKLCHQEFPGFYALRHQKNTEHGFPINGANVDSEDITNEVDALMMRISKRSCAHTNISWVYSELEPVRHKVFNIFLDNLNAKIVDEKIDLFLNHLRCATKVNLAFRLVLENLEDGGFRYFHAHENNTLPDRSKLVCTREDLAKLKDFFNKTDVIEPCSPKSINTKGRFYKLTNLTVFVALLKDVPIKCKDAVLPEPLLKNCTISCLIFEENTRQPYNDNLCLFRAPTLYLHGNQRLEETSKLFKLIDQ